MKEILKGFLIGALVLFCWAIAFYLGTVRWPITVSPLWAAEPVHLALTTPIQAVVGAGVSAAAGGTWYHSNAADKRGDSLVENPNSFYLGTAVTIGTTTNVTKLAIKIANALSATEAKIAICTKYSASQFNASPTYSTCTPSTGNWCIATVNYTATASATYYVMVRSNSDMRIYGDTDGGTGIYGNDGNYAGFPPAINFTYTDSYAQQFAVAICTGTCSGGPE